jgi:D-xylose transport system ATP-binding protein
MDEKRTLLVELRGISVSFGGIHAVKDALIDLYADNGGNGAGKSTLMKVLSGAQKRDSGEVLIDGAKVSINNPRDAKALGVETIYQTLALADNIDAASNLFLGREILTMVKTLDDVAMEAATRKVMGRLNPPLWVSKTPSRLSLGRTTASRRHRSGDIFQRPHPDHGRNPGSKYVAPSSPNRQPVDDVLSLFRFSARDP